MRNIIIIGTGAVASELTFFIENNNSINKNDEKINILGYIEYEYNIENFYKKYDFEKPILCDVDSYIPNSNEEVLIGISDTNFRNKIIHILLNKNAKIANFIHHTAIISKTPNMGIGNIVYPFCVIEPNSIIGDFNFLTSYSSISHDCVVGNGNFFSTTGIAGHVRIGNNNFFGIRSIVIPHVEIGNNNVIQAGMTVNKSIKNDTTIFYRYKEKVIAIPK